MKKLLSVLIYSLIVNAIYSQSDLKLLPGSSSPGVINDSTVTDIDGNVYHTVTIGSQIWMIENLRTTHYRNGEVILNITIDSLWVDASIGAWCDYNNDTLNDSKFGKLYNYFAIEDTRNLAPEGWHIPTATEWAILEDYLAIIDFKQNEIKPENKKREIKRANLLAAPTDWAKSTESGAIGSHRTLKNSTGFNGLPGGCRSANGTFKSITKSGYWWCVNTSDNNMVFSRSLSYDTNVLGLNLGFKVRGLSVRCIKD